jgi:hypothetical protein
VEQGVRLSALVSFRGEKRMLSHDDLRKLTELLVSRAQRSLDWVQAFPRLSTLRFGPQVGAVHGVPTGIQVERDG